MNPDPTTLEGSPGLPLDDSPLEAEPVDTTSFVPGHPDGMHGLPAPTDVETDNGSLPLLFTFVALILAFGAFRSWWIPGIVAGLLFMLFMHEFGHFVTARASGMKVSEFFLGFGPKIWSFNRGETEYGVKAIPAGAYVRIMGMTNLEDINPAEEHRTYRSQPYWQRMIVICAGSAMHFLMAFVALIVLFGAFGYQGFNGPPWEVRQVVAGSTADVLGVQVGDRIVEFDGDDITTWEDFGEIVTTTPIGPVRVTVERDGVRIPLSGELGARSGDIVGAGFGLIINEDQASQGWTVEHVIPDSNAAEFGIEDADVLMRVDTVGRPTQLELAQLLTNFENQALEFSVLRGLETENLSGTVALDRTTEFRGFFGIGPIWPEQAEASWGESVGLAARDFGTVAETNVRGLANLLNPAQLLGLFDSDDDASRTAPASAPGRPAPIPEPDEGGNRPVSMIGIGRLIADSESTDQVIFLFMVVNIFVGLFNLVPLLPLDGGHAAIATYERGRSLVTGRPHRVDAAKLVPITWAVMLLLVGFGLWAAVLDIFSWPA